MKSFISRNPILSSNMKDGEKKGAILGQTTKNGVPVSVRVMCYHRMSGRLIKITNSDINGYYRFDRLSAGAKYYVTSLDEVGDGVQYNAVTQDLITAGEVVL